MLFLWDPSPIMHWQCLSLTDSLTHCRLVNLIDVTLACEDLTQNLLRLLLLLMLAMRIMLATVCCRFGSWGLVIKPYFCSDFQHKVWSRFWSWSWGEILKLKFGQYFAADVWLRLQSWILMKILKQSLVKILSLNLIEILMFARDLEVNAYRNSELDIWWRCVQDL